MSTREPCATLVVTGDGAPSAEAMVRDCRGDEAWQVCATNEWLERQELMVRALSSGDQTHLRSR